MRIGVNTLFLIPGEVGGTETYLRETLRALAELSEDVEWVLFTNRENDGYLRRIFGPFRHVTFHPLPLPSMQVSVHAFVAVPRPRLSVRRGKVLARPSAGRCG